MSIDGVLFDALATRYGFSQPLGPGPSPAPSLSLAVAIFGRPTNATARSIFCGYNYVREQLLRRNFVRLNSLAKFGYHLLKLFKPNPLDLSFKRGLLSEDIWKFACDHDNLIAYELQTNHRLMMQLIILLQLSSTCNSFAFN